MIFRRKKWSTTVVSKSSFRTQPRRKRSRIFHSRIALMIEKSYGEAGIYRDLIGICLRSRDLVQAEPRQQVGLVRNTVIDADGKLVGVRINLRGRLVGASTVSSCWIVRQRISSQYWGYF